MNNFSEHLQSIQKLYSNADYSVTKSRAQRRNGRKLLVIAAASAVVGVLVPYALIATAGILYASFLEHRKQKNSIQKLSTFDTTSITNLSKFLTTDVAVNADSPKSLSYIYVELIHLYQQTIIKNLELEKRFNLDDPNVDLNSVPEKSLLLTLQKRKEELYAFIDSGQPLTKTISAHDRLIKKSDFAEKKYHLKDLGYQPEILTLLEQFGVSPNYLLDQSILSYSQVKLLDVFTPLKQSIAQLLQMPGMTEDNRAKMQMIKDKALPEVEQMYIDNFNQKSHPQIEAVVEQLRLEVDALKSVQEEAQLKDVTIMQKTLRQTM